MFDSRERETPYHGRAEAVLPLKGLAKGSWEKGTEKISRVRSKWQCEKTAFSLLPLEGGAPKGRRLDGDSGISETKPSPRGEGGERSEPDRVLAV